MSQSLWNADLHLHTNLSYCAPRDTVPETYLPFCEDEDIRILGFSNHLYPPYRISEHYESACPGVEKNLQIVGQLRELRKKTNYKLLLGCEIETVHLKEPSLPPEYAGHFDYVLLAASHILNLSQDYQCYDFSTPDKLRDMLLDRFIYACHLDYKVPTGICHPLCPICAPFEQEVVDGISDSTLSDCFSLAAQKNISIEIHACLYRGGTQLNQDGISPSYLRVLSAAKSCGCKFHFGSDAHAPNAFIGVHQKLRHAAETVGITQDDMWDLPGLN